MTDGSICLDEYVIVACPPGDALECLDGPVAIAGWFGCKRAGSQTTIASAGGDLVLELAHEEWRPDDGALLVIGTTDDLWLRAYLTVRAVMQPGAHPYVHPGTEIWTHVEFGPACRASRLTALLHKVLRDGLEHLRLELDTF